VAEATEFKSHPAVMETNAPVPIPTTPALRAGEFEGVARLSCLPRPNIIIPLSLGTAAAHNFALKEFELLRVIFCG
jgi:hypothetical protein